MASIFKAYDIRGLYPDEVNEEVAFRIGAAYVRLLSAKRIVIGYDMRLSSPTLAEAFADGAMSAGSDVMDIGMVTTPLLYFAIIDGGYDGGAMVTASHLPQESNGFKLCREKAIPLSGDAGLPALEKMVAGTGGAVAGPIKTGQCGHRSVLPAYIDRLKSFVHEPIPLKMVIDAGNGAAGPEVLPLTQPFHMWQVTPMYMEPDGRFPHHVANPLIPKNTEDLRAEVVRQKADIGIAFDGDADRCGFIDEKGETIPEDLVTALISQFYLAKSPGATILYDLRSSRAVPETITAPGGPRRKHAGGPCLHQGRYAGVRRDLRGRAFRPFLFPRRGLHRQRDARHDPYAQPPGAEERARLDAYRPLAQIRGNGGDQHGGRRQG